MRGKERPKDERPAEAEGSAGEEELLPALLEQASSELYRRSGFRVTGLPVNATPREIRRTCERLLMSRRLGGGDVQDELLSFGPPLEPDAVRQAIDRLRDPERRIVSQFFWFWPKERDGAETDEALVALQRGDLGTAEQSWVAMARDGRHGGIARHNLAVLRHATAIGKGAAGPFAQDSEERGDADWSSALREWRAVLDEPQVWSRLDELISELDDPRLTATTGRRLRATLPLGLLSINAQRAVEAARGGAVAEAHGHVRLLHDAGFGPAVAHEALRRAVEPTLRHLSLLIEIYDERSERMPEDGGQAARTLLDAAKPLIAIVDTVLPNDHPSRQHAHDRAAVGALDCAISYYNETADPVLSLQLLDDAYEVALGAATKERIERNMAIIRGNQAWATCWFCGDREPDDAAAIPVPMYGNVTRTDSGEGTLVEWRKRTPEAPRCRTCRSGHRRHRALRVWTVVMVLLGGWVAYRLGGAAGTALFGATGTQRVNVPSALSAVVILVLVTALLYRLVLTTWTGTGLFPPQPVRRARDFPPIQELREEGWHFGTSPPTSG